MGIAKFRGLLEPYARRCSPKGMTFVVDGPSFAYYVFACCMRGPPNSTLLEEPSYKDIGDAAISWLDRLHASGNHVYICFSAAKKRDRLHRLAGSASQLRNYAANKTSGIPPPKYLARLQAKKKGEEFISGPSYEGPRRPTVPFLVPAVLEALLSTEEYGHVTKVVPGEADDFCAEHVRLHGGTVISSDSDLLVHDLGPNGAMIFFDDLKFDIGTPSAAPSALEYKGHDICNRLALGSSAGLQELAFALSQPHQSLGQAIQACRQKHSETMESTAFREFVQRYNSPERGADGSLEIATLDPRLSEFVLHQCPGNVLDQELGCEVMYLPNLIDSLERTTAWESSVSIRKLAYLHLQLVKNNKFSHVEEFRRVQSKPVTGTKLELPDAAAIESESTRLFDVLSKISPHQSTSDPFWFMLSVYFDIVMTANQGKKHPLSLELIAGRRQSHWKPMPWDLVHFFAQVQATCYSLRMLQQVVGLVVLRFGEDSLSAATSNLRSFLALLPPIAGFPTLHEFSDTLQEFAQDGGLRCLATCDLPEEMMPLLEAAMRTKVGRGTQKRKNPSRLPRKSNTARSKPRILPTFNITTLRSPELQDDNSFHLLARLRPEEEC